MTTQTTNWVKDFGELGYDIEWKPMTDRIGSCWRLTAKHRVTKKRNTASARSTDECCDRLYSKLAAEALTLKAVRESLR